MKYMEFKFKTDDGSILYAREWRPESEVRGVICLIHGLGDHSERYPYLAMALTQEGYTLLSYDQRGHGQSLGQRGDVPSYESLLDDIDSFGRESSRRFPNLPLFLYGHSLGGNLVLNYVLRRKSDFVGVIATSPWLRLAFEPSWLQVKLALVMNKLWPSFSQSNSLVPSALSHDIAVVEAYRVDPLVHNQISARLFMSAYQAGLWAIENAVLFDKPLLLMHGGDDHITSVAATAQFVKQAPQDCTLKIWPGLYHELHNELEKVEIMSYLINWLKSKTPASD